MRPMLGDGGNRPVGRIRGAARSDLARPGRATTMSDGAGAGRPAQDPDRGRGQDPAAAGTAEEASSMPITQVSNHDGADRIGAAPARALRAIYARIGQLLVATDRLRRRGETAPPGRPGGGTRPVRSRPARPSPAAPEPAAPPARRSLDQTGNVRLLSADDLADEAPVAEPAASAAAPEAAAPEAAAPAEPAEPAEPGGSPKPPEAATPAPEPPAPEPQPAPAPAPPRAPAP